MQAKAGLTYRGMYEMRNSSPSRVGFRTLYPQAKAPTVEEATVK
jgi:hypothetical protein